jgi:DNA gyrase subunit A
VRFKESDVRVMGRTARGVRGISLPGGHRVISLIIPQTDGFVLSASENGYGKRTDVREFPVKGRGTQGVIAMQTTQRNGVMVGAVQVFSGDEIMLISNLGTLVRTKADEVSLLSRNTQGVRLIDLRGDEKLVGVQRIVESDAAVEAVSAAVEGGDDSEGSDPDVSDVSSEPGEPGDLGESGEE